MNVFEELVDELKRDNLLEDTVMEAVSKTAPESGFIESHDSELDSAESETAKSIADENYEERLVEEMPPVEDSDLQMANGETVEIRKAASEKEFFQNRAVGEVSSLKMVEHVLTGVEREYMKIVPNAFDDFNAKVALNNFIQVTEAITSDEHKHAEFALMQETEAWCSALAERDKHISVGSVRRYCENATPMLSSQAMLALARFYRNLPYSEGVRGKFDFILTKLFSRPTHDQTRKLLFTRTEMLGHIKTLYADWSSISLYITDDMDENAMLTAAIFEDFAKEAMAAKEFDELIRSDFFSRIRLFKESITELFFAPVVTAAAIESNITIGNVYIKLIEREKERSNAAIVHDKYSYVDETAVSDATGRTLELIDLLRDRSLEFEEDEIDAVAEEVTETIEIPAPKTAIPETAGRVRTKLRRFDFLGMNRALVAICVLLIISSVGLYVWANYFIEDAPALTSVRNFDIANSPFMGELKVARVSGENFYGVLLPTWETMTKQRQQDLLQRIHQAGPTNGWSRVNLMDGAGKTVAYSTPTRMELVNPQP